MNEGRRQPRITAVLQLDVDRRLDLCQTFDAARAALDLPISPIEISARTAVGRAAARGDPMARWRPDSAAGIAYQRLAAEHNAVPSFAGKGIDGVVQGRLQAQQFAAPPFRREFSFRAP